MGRWVNTVRNACAASELARCDSYICTFLKSITPLTDSACRMSCPIRKGRKGHCDDAVRDSVRRRNFLETMQVTSSESFGRKSSASERMSSEIRMISGSRSNGSRRGSKMYGSLLRHFFIHLCQDRLFPYL